MYEIEVKNKQNFDGQIAVSEEKAECTLDFRGGKIYIIYKSDDGDGDEVKTAIIISESKTVIRRSGFINSTMVYRVGEETVFPYEIPYGDILMRLFTEKIDYDFTESGGRLKLVYTLDAHNEKYSNDMTITVREIL